MMMDTIYIPRHKPPKKPAGIAKCDDLTKQRWKADDYRYAPYQYKEENLITTARGELRPPNAEEREVGHGFPLHYTRMAMPAHVGKRFPQALEDTRCSQVGNGLAVPVAAFLMANLLVSTTTHS